MGEAEFERGLNCAADAVHAAAMAFGARQSALGGPAAIAVHDDRDMARCRPFPRDRRLIHRKRHVELLIPAIAKAAARPT
jgi:hypothetical protein